MQFSDVIGQRDVKQHLVDMISQNRLSHALLFSGREGSGALLLALAFAQYIMCEKVRSRLAPPAASLFGADKPASNEPLSDACGVCNACKKAAGLVHPD